jgi:hypothetical protein
MLSLATFMPASIRASIFSGLATAGPSVAKILALLIITVQLAIHG